MKRFGFTLLLLAAFLGHGAAATFNIAAGNVSALKTAIVAAGANGEDDIINLAAGATYTLVAVDNTSSGSPTGLPVVRADGGKSLTINGNGAVIVRQSGATPEFRIFHIGQPANVTMNALTVENGNLFGTGNGAAIYNEFGNLTLVDCTISNNQAVKTGSGATTTFGGGIYNEFGTLDLRRCTFSGNGAVATSNGSSAVAFGGAIYNQNGTVRVQLCTFSTNSAFANSVSSGGGDGPASASGGAIESAGSGTGTARVIVNNATFSGNSASTGNFGNGPGTAIRVAAGGSATATLSIGGSILAGSGSVLSNQGGTITSQGYNLADGSGGGFLNAVGDQLNTDPQLRPLAANGGPTRTHALAITSPAIDKGKRDAVPALAVTTDQRGAPRPFAFPGATSAPGGDRSDIGAFEKTEPSLLVTTTSDHNDGSCTAADCTLREAITAANAQPSVDTIGFAAGVTGTIQLTAALPMLTTDVEIVGPGADVLTIRRDTGGSYRLFTISNGASVGPDVTLIGLTLTNGQGVGSGAGGGAIYNDFAKLQIQRCAIIGNNGGNGAGIQNFRGTVFVSNSTISNNNATGFGGAFFNNAAQGPASITLTNCTVSGNTADRGAAIHNAGATGLAQVALQNCTLAANSATLGTISNSGASARITLGNTILSAGATGSTFLIGSGAIVVSQGHNLSSDAAGGDAGTGPGGLLNATGDKRNTDPKLAATGLQNNGGPTPTIAVQSDSPAINTGNDAMAPAFDQRGFGRSGVSDIGAFEFGGISPTPPPTPTPSPTATPAPTATPTPNRFANISTRMRVETGDNVLIGGFIVTGSMQKRIIVRALGPSLPVDGKLSNPVLELYDAGGNLLALNDNWRDAANQQEIFDSTIAPPNELEAAILQNVDLGLHTALVRDAADAQGIGLVEVYDLGANQDSKLANISTRGRVLTGDDVMIGGLIITGSSPQRVIIRAIGPSLGIAGQLEDPLLELFDSQGNQLAANNNWKDSQQAEIEATGIPPSNDLDSAIVTSLTPAFYTAVVRGVNDSTGVGLVEAYALND